MKQHSEVRDWGKSFMHSIHQAHFLIQKRLEQHLLETDNISFAQFLVLIPVRRQGTSSQAEIAEATSLTEATVSRHVSALTETGLLSRKEDPDNRRKYILALTPKGDKAILKAHDAIQDVAAEIYSKLSTEERAHVISSLGRVSEFMLAQIK